ncbi:MAG: polynucleotide adenylyltransferase PcnB [Planctomycetota bacterium]|nr:polynucleotide adenylyltransferase PcnB [Planctomycetota bacterium]MDP6762352.1 polynucleotide adenylyltransferase PcnB [Planctomycetota bacterium]MDP6990031.1 polynucleotide adenylyltransferase PcnB [Planctomycetota bacterium]
MKTPPDEPPGDRPRIIDAPDLARRVRSENAERVISRLARNGHEAYLVGGCVRDLLVGRRPKDFDVATSATPRQVRRLFPRNSHIIGRRFRLVHVRYGAESIIETATFRREPQPREGDDEDLLIVEDNVFGTAAEDARRRDFTVNGLFLDPNAERIIDFVGGLEDLDARLLRTIGPPRVRMQEDPVRILRAIKFATRLDFHIEDETWNAMCDTAPELERSAPPRVLEEILRLMRSGTALGSFRKLRRCGALQAILPELDSYLGPLDHPSEAERDRSEEFRRLLEALDNDVHGGYEPTTPVCLALLYHGIVERDVAERGVGDSMTELARLTGEHVDALCERARLSRRHSGRTRRILVQQDTFLRGSSRHFRPRLFCLGEDFPEALELFRLRAAALGRGWDIYEGWAERYREARAMPPEEVEAERRKGRRRGGRRERRRRRRGG